MNMKEGIAVKLDETEDEWIKKQEWVGVAKAKRDDMYKFGPVLWERLRKEGVNPFRDLPNYYFWSEFIDPNFPPNRIVTTSVSSSYPNPGMYKNIWIVDLKEETLELKRSVSLLGTLIDDVEEVKSEIKRVKEEKNVVKEAPISVRLNKWVSAEPQEKVWLYDKNVNTWLDSNHPEALKHIRLGKFDLNDEEPNWELLARLCEEARLVDEEISKEESPTLKLKNEVQRSCSICGKAIPGSKCMGIHPNLAHRNCYEELIEELGSDKYFLNYTNGIGY